MPAQQREYTHRRRSDRLVLVASAIALEHHGARVESTVLAHKGIAVCYYVLCLEEPSEGLVAVVKKLDIPCRDALGGTHAGHV